ncbi:MAG: AAA family ATPase [Proteobacteria bacterium]|nr:AAA family ATPase [Pseudomonadota bacterium]
MANSKYGDVLQQGRDLTEDVRQGRQTQFRDSEVGALARAISAGRSALLVGAPGVGKTSIVRGLAGYLPRIGKRKVYQFASVQFLSGTVYLGEWQSKVTTLFDAASQSKAVLYLSDIWNLPAAGHTSTSSASVWDAMRPRLEKSDLQVVGEVTPEQLLALRSVPGFASLFEIIEIAPLSAEQISALVRTEARDLRVDLDEPGAQRILELCAQFLPTSAGPGPALKLVEQVRDYEIEKRGVGENEPVSSFFVEKVFSVYSGLPRFVVSRSEVRAVSEIREWFRARIIGQRDAIDAVVQVITLFKAGLHDPRRPIGSLMFVGPTGVGKTELARALSTYLFGSEKRLLRFDLSEFKDYHSFEALIGDPKNPDRPARLVDSVRDQPFQVVLLDEIEKAHANVWDLLLQILDDGRLTPGVGPAVSFRNAIVIATANIGAQAMERQPIGFASQSGADDARLQAELESVFRPELLNRFQHIVRFRKLSKLEVRDIARIELSRALEREGIVARQLSVDVDPEVLDVVIARGYDEKYGARALKRQLQGSVIMPIATLLMERSVLAGSVLRLTVRHGEIKVHVVETEATRARRAEAEPLRLADGRRLDPPAIRAMLAGAQRALSRILGSAEIQSAFRERDELVLRRAEGDLWKDPRAAADLLERLDRIERIADRISHLQQQQSELESLAVSQISRDELSRFAERVRIHEGSVRDSAREIVALGTAGYPDAIVEIAPIGNSRRARDFLYKLYVAWCDERKLSVLMLREPMADEEPVMFLVTGPYAFGYLRAEVGHHRLRDGRDSWVARVAVAPVSIPARPISVAHQRALKQMGQFEGRVRSRLESEGARFVLQNARSVAENGEWLDDLAPSWLDGSASPDLVVRRYDISPFLLKDFLTDLTTGRADVLKPAAFHELLCSRIDALDRRDDG